MLSQREDYKLVTPPQGFEIDGGIMPARDAAGGGAWMRLRGEDECFLREASMRARIYSFRSRSDYSAAIAEDLRKDPFRYAVTDVHGAAYNGRTWPAAPALDQTKVASSGQGYAFLRDVAEWGDSDVVHFVDGCLASASRSAAVSWASSLSDFSAGAPLEADAVRRLYWDLRRVKGILGPVGTVAYGSVSTMTTNEWYQGDSPSSPSYTNVSAHTPGGSVFTFEKGTEQSFIRAESLVYDWTATGLQPPENASHPEDMALLSPTTCWVLVRVESRLYASGSSPTEAHVDAYVAQGSVSQDGSIAFGVSASSLRDLVLARSGYYSDVWSMPDGYTETASAYAVGVLFYDEAIDTSGIDWSWTPEGGN